MSKVPNVLFPFNGQLFTFERFVEQIEKLIAAAKTYDTGVATPVDRKVRKQIIQLMAERLRHGD